MPDAPLISTAELDPAALHAGFGLAFADYVAGPFQLMPAQWSDFLARQGVDLELGRALLQADGSVGALALVAPRAALGHWRLATMGIVPALRGSGAAQRLLAELIARARASGQQALELEVVVQNPRALRLYERHGFVVRHRLRGWQRAAAAPPDAAPAMPPPLPPAAALDWLQAAEQQIADLPLQVGATSIAALPPGWQAWRLGSAQLVASVDMAGGQLLLRSLIDSEPAQRDAEALLRACLGAHAGIAASMPPLQRDDLGGTALARCGFQPMALSQELMRLDLC